jgi:hypothetical protein
VLNAAGVDVCENRKKRASIFRVFRHPPPSGKFDFERNARREADVNPKNAQLARFLRSRTTTQPHNDTRATSPTMLARLQAAAAAADTTRRRVAA